MAEATPAQLGDLIARMSSGDRAAFEDIYAATSPKLFGVVLRIIRQRELAEEVLQEAFIRIWRNAARYDAEKAAPMTWMASIARNRAIDEVRRRGLDLVDDPDAAALVRDPGPSPADAAALGESVRALSHCLEELESPRGEMVRLAYLEGYSREALADRFDQPVGTVKTWLRRSLMLLRDCLDR
jgi:RNA polymerase sigma-70 factor (ECF subfamily)